MSKKLRHDAIAFLTALRAKERALAAARPAPLTAIPPDEARAFDALRALLAPSRLLTYLDRRGSVGAGARLVSIDEAVLEAEYPGVDPLTGPLPAVDAF